ncbi:hypothetical protein SCHPADRAFT_287663 [Schizopora paradoxa]|uniref:Uncharacterized protein n=1 Tax=Schizopora paradoxa TaxID=27342 RepID=A0A0H2RT38_9AGAM|nr:hypothetical protein SCHPADRAFT_287663 [Schizopora paradoxa]
MLRYSSIACALSSLNGPQTLPKCEVQLYTGMIRNRYSSRKQSHLTHSRADTNVTSAERLYKKTRKKWTDVPWSIFGRGICRNRICCMNLLSTQSWYSTEPSHPAQKNGRNSRSILNSSFHARFDVGRSVRVHR